MRQRARSAAPQAAGTPDPMGMSAVKVGWIAAAGVGAEPRVDFAGNPAGGPIGARVVATVDRAALEAAALTRQPVLLVFEDGDRTRPIVVALLHSESSPFAQLLAGGQAVAGETRSAPAADAPVEAKVDGRRVVIEGKDEVVLSCGAASITLRKDGRVVVAGRYVEANASGTNRIRGGVVKIN